MLMETKGCTECGDEKPIDAFPFAGSSKKYRRGKCRDCTNKYFTDKRREDPKWAAARKAEGRRYHLKVKYSITETEYDDLLEKQNGRCAICKEICTTGRRLAVDHNHQTGAIRGLLCGRCNRGIGHFRDNPELLKSVIIYLTA